MTLVEAYATGLPVVGSAIGSLRNWSRTSARAASSSRKCRRSGERARVDDRHPREVAEQGRRARQTFEQRYTAERNYAELLAIYQTAGERARRSA